MKRKMVNKKDINQLVQKVCPRRDSNPRALSSHGNKYRPPLTNSAIWDKP